MLTSVLSKFGLSGVHLGLSIKEHLNANLLDLLNKILQAKLFWAYFFTRSQSQTYDYLFGGIQNNKSNGMIQLEIFNNKQGGLILYVKLVNLRLILEGMNERKQWD